MSGLAYVRDVPCFDALTLASMHTTPSIGKQMIDDTTFKEAMSYVCGPVTVITTMTPGAEPYGTTVSSFASLSMDPPLAMFALDQQSRLLAHCLEFRRVGINILSSSQKDSAMSFAQSGGAKFDGVEWTESFGVPRLTGCCAWMTGDIETDVPGGDHRLLIVRLVGGAVGSGEPLVYGRRTFGTHASVATE